MALPFRYFYAYMFFFYHLLLKYAICKYYFTAISVCDGGDFMHNIIYTIIKLPTNY